MKFLRWNIFAAAFLSLASFAQEPNLAWDFDSLARVPIQNGGRLKPLDTFSREAVLTLTGRRSWKNWKPLDFLLSLIAFPEEWKEQSFIRLGNPDVRKQLLLPLDRKYFSLKELYSSPVVR